MLAQDLLILKKMSSRKLVTLPHVEQVILSVRRERVILDADLAQLYGVSTRTLNQAVKRNRKRFPDDFLFRLTKEEKNEVVTICDHLKKLKYSRTLPYAFTEHGAIMAASVLNTQRAVEVSVYVVRAFVKLREIISSHKEIVEKLVQLERKIVGHDAHIRSLFDAIRQLMLPPKKKKRPIGFR